jgi:hypothetical protein
VRSRDSAVGVAIGYGLEFESRWGKNFHFSVSSRSALGSTYPPIQWVPAALSSGVKRPGREADNSPPTSAEVKKTWTYTSTPTYAFMALCLISQAQKHLYLTLPSWEARSLNWSRNSSLFRQPIGSIELPSSDKIVTGSYPETAESRQPPQFLFIYVQF